MTGFFVRVVRNGRPETVEVERLTDAELDALAALQPDAGWRWAKGLARWVRDHVREEQGPGAGGTPPPTVY